ncbi:TPA: ABC transporter ATP-binding protein [Streptococcus pyogenes]|nr:ABC transporter ATP-binding protein [Streptococcus pyogenes]HES6015293.1 ABC transporter ATP-binding protein [Streptococcus pyogenes]
MNVIEADIKKFSYDGNDKVILKDIELNIKEGELVVISGLSGCGKTTLTRILNGLIPNHYQGQLYGQVSILGKNISQYNNGELAKYIGNVFQNPTDQFFANIVEDELAFVGENLGMDLSELKKRVDDSLSVMGIENLKYRNINSLSGGQKQKVAISSTLVYDTKIIFFDEPSSNLDYRGIVELKNILEKLKSLGKTIIISEHRLFYLNDLYDRFLYMKDGKIEKVFKKDELTEEDCKNYSLRTTNYNFLLSENIDNCKNVVEDIRGVGISIGKKELIKNLNISLYENEIMAIIGKNGVGKTTLARSLAGLLNFKGKTSFGRNKKERLRNSYYMMQDVEYQIFFDTVENELLQKDRINDNGYLDRLRKELKHIDLWENRYDHPQNLSGGQKQRLALLTACLSGRKLIILDEPTSGLDYKRMNDISQIIKRYSKTYPFAIITHDIELIFKVCNSVLMLGKNGYKKVNIQGHEKEILEFIKDGLIV